MPTGVCVGGPMDGQNYSGGGTHGVIFIGENNIRHAYSWDEGNTTFRYMALAVDPSREEEMFGDGKWEMVDLP